MIVGDVTAVLHLLGNAVPSIERVEFKRSLIYLLIVRETSQVNIRPHSRLVEVLALMERFPPLLTERFLLADEEVRAGLECF